MSSLRNRIGVGVLALWLPAGGCDGDASQSLDPVGIPPRVDGGAPVGSSISAPPTSAMGGAVLPIPRVDAGIAAPRTSDGSHSTPSNTPPSDMGSTLEAGTSTTPN